MGNTLIIMDSFALPVQGTETRVNAANEANEYMVEYTDKSEKVLYAFDLSHHRLCSLHFALGRTIGKCHRLVSLTPRIWLLAVRYRRQHTVE